MQIYDRHEYGDSVTFRVQVLDTESCEIDIRGVVRKFLVDFARPRVVGTLIYAEAGENCYFVGDEQPFLKEGQPVMDRLSPEMRKLLVELALQDERQAEAL